MNVHAGLWSLFVAYVLLFCIFFFVCLLFVIFITVNLNMDCIFVFIKLSLFGAHTSNGVDVEQY